MYLLTEQSLKEGGFLVLGVEPEVHLRFGFVLLYQRPGEDYLRFSFALFI